MGTLRAVSVSIVGLSFFASVLHAQLPVPQRLLDVAVGPGGSSGALFGPSPRTGELLFFADDGVHGYELWRTDGTSANTGMLADLSPGAASTSHWDVAVVGERAVMVVQRAGAWELWSTDGVPGSMTLLLTAPVGSILQTELQRARDGGAYFAIDGDLWRTDGTSGGTFALHAPWGDVVGEVAGLDVIQAWGGDVAVVDGTAATLVANIPGTLSQTADGRWLRIEREVVGMTPLHHVQWLDGPGAPQITLNVFFVDVQPVDGGFVITTSSSQLFVWAGGPTPELVGTFAEVELLGSFAGEAVLRIDDGVSGSELWLSDGTLAGTRLVDLAPGPAGSAPSLHGELDGRMLLWLDVAPIGREPWLSDGTFVGSTPLADLAPGAASSGALEWGSAPSEFVAGGRRRRVLRVSTPATGIEVMVTDGTAAGTALLADINPGPASSSNGGDAGDGLMMLAGDAMVWFADDGVTGYEPWVLPLPGTSNRLRDYGPSTFTTGDPVLGGLVDLSMTDIPNGQVAFVMLGEPLADAFSIDGLRALHLDPATAVVAAVVVPSPAGAWSGALPLPNVPSAVGLDLVAQPVLLPAPTPFGVQVGAARWWSLGF